MRIATRTLVPLAAVTALALTGCSGASDAAPAPAQSPGAVPTATPGGGQRQRQGTNGLIAAITGSTLQVQGSSGQTAVTWTDATAFTRQVAVPASEVTVGACVVGFGQSAEGSDAVTVSALTLSDPVDGACQGGFGGGRGDGAMPGPGATPPAGRAGATPPPGMRSPGAGATPPAMPSGAPTGAPGGMPGTPVAGTVAAVDGSTLSVTRTAQDGTTSTVTVTLAADATVTATRAAQASDAAVGQCASAQGTTDSTGAVTATSIRLSEATDGACTLGGMRR